MRIHFSNVNFSSQTGPNSFAHRLANQLTKMGHEIVPVNENYDAFLAFIEPASRPDPTARFVQRLDGIWFKPEQFKTHNQVIKWAYDNSDAVIWQSEFDRQMTEHHWGARSGRVIRNGIELKKFEPAKNHDVFEYSPLFVCSANWHPQKRLADNIKLFQKIRKSHKDSGLLIMGNNAELEVSGKDLDPTNVFILGNLTHQMCLSIFARADWMIHLAWLDHCPNVVVEALSQNCPIICAQAGGTKELVRGRGIVIEDDPYNFELCDYDNPPRLDFSSFVLPDKPEFDSRDLDIILVAKQYEKVLEDS